MRATWPLIRLAVLAVLLCCLAPAAPAALVKDEDDAPARERALKLNDITGSETITAQIVTLLEDKPGTKKLLAAAHKLAKEKDKTKEQPFNVNATWILARAAAGLKQVDVAEYFYRQHSHQALKLGSSRKFVDSYTALINLLLANKKYAESEKVCREFLELKGDDTVQRYKILVLRRLVQTLTRMGKTEEAMKIVDNLLKAQPDNWLTLDLKGWVLREQGKYDEAVKVYEDVLERLPNDKRLDKKQIDEFVADIRYTLSGVYVEMNKIDKAAEQLRALLVKEPNYPTYNNDLGFILADHDMKLDEAEKLVRKALAEDKKLRKKEGKAYKDNAAYLDSLGWVLFKQKKYKEALVPLEEAVKQEEGQHMEIYDHLGDVFVALGDKAKAVEAWKKGLTCTPVSKRDERRKGELEKKIKKYDKGE